MAWHALVLALITFWCAVRPTLLRFPISFIFLFFISRLLFFPSRLPRLPLDLPSLPYWTCSQEAQLTLWCKIQMCSLTPKHWPGPIWRGYRRPDLSTSPIKAGNRPATSKTRQKPANSNCRDAPLTCQRLTSFCFCISLIAYFITSCS